MKDSIINLLAAIGAIHLFLDVCVLAGIWVASRGFKRDEELADALEHGRRKEKRPLSA